MPEATVAPPPGAGAATFLLTSVGSDALGPVFAGEPDTSVWRSAPGDWTEW